MSTFNGIVSEFPRIRIDFFRRNPAQPPPLACFLSHVHSDHLTGLESLRAPFVYCSAVTKEILLRIEKYPHRMNFTKGILESRKQHYRHLNNLLKPIPLETPTEIELGPRCRLRVTLFNANHCPGAVMFLIEGDGKAVLYTGDIRSESWWVSSLRRSPVLMPYASGLKVLDKIYLDTTFATKSEIYREFPSKSDGLHELLNTVKRYSPGTIFYFKSWTLGYEDVWRALATFLDSQVHVDRYQLSLFRVLSTIEPGYGNHETLLCDYKLGNQTQKGILTMHQDVKIHSCEPGTQCAVRDNDRTVWILPIITRSAAGTIVPEVGAGGGGNDLYQTHELELGFDNHLKLLTELCRKQIQDPEKLAKVLLALHEAFKTTSKSLSLDQLGLRDQENDPSIQDFIVRLEQGDFDRGISDSEQFLDADITEAGCPKEELPRVIRFPYSRHSSYSELAELVAAFRPKDIHACTVNPDTWSEECSMRTLFGQFCSANIFAHDEEIRTQAEGKREAQEDIAPTRKRRRSASTESRPSQDQDAEPQEDHFQPPQSATSSRTEHSQNTVTLDYTPFTRSTETRQRAMAAIAEEYMNKLRRHSSSPEIETYGLAPRLHQDVPEHGQNDDSTPVGDSQTTISTSAFESQGSISQSQLQNDGGGIKEARIEDRKAAYKAVRESLRDSHNDKSGDDQHGAAAGDGIVLISVADGHDEEELEL